MTQEDLQRPRVNIVQAMAIAGVCRRTIYNWIHAEWVEIARTPSGQVRIFADTLLTPDGYHRDRRPHN